MAERERPSVVALYCYFTTLIGTTVKAFAGTGRAGDGLTAKDKLAHASHLCLLAKATAAARLRCSCDLNLEVKGLTTLVLPRRCLPLLLWRKDASIRDAGGAILYTTLIRRIAYGIHVLLRFKTPVE